MSDSYLKWLPVFIKVQDEAYAKSSPKMSCHDASHHLRVWELARKAGENYDHDPEVLIAACMLHDLSAHRADLYFDGVETQVNDSMLAEKVLNGVAFPVGKIPLVLDAIRWHGSDPSFVEKRTGIEGQLLCDADKIEALGPIGVARIIAALVNRGWSIRRIIEEYTVNKLDKKFNAITLPEFKEMARPRYEYSKKFFADLAETLGIV